MTRAKTVTPVRRALRRDSSLHLSVLDGLGALKTADGDCLDVAIRSEFSDSLDADQALQGEHNEENRWDYLLGHTPSQEVVAVEPHTAKTGEVSRVIKKRQAALAQLRPHLREGARISSWLWVASGHVHFADTEKARRQLDQNGIQFVGKRVMAKHLPRRGHDSKPDR